VVSIEQAETRRRTYSSVSSKQQSFSDQWDKKNSFDRWLTTHLLAAQRDRTGM